MDPLKCTAGLSRESFSSFVDYAHKGRVTFASVTSPIHLCNLRNLWMNLERFKADLSTDDADFEDERCRLQTIPGKEQSSCNSHTG
jgi:hypothetical protein